jgi:hypothetical protein
MPTEARNENERRKERDKKGKINISNEKKTDFVELGLLS